MAKRVNTRFLLLLTVMVVIGGMALMAARFVLPRLWKQDPQALVAQSKELEAAGKIDEAIAKYQGAVRAGMQDPALRIGLGDLYDRHVAHDMQNLGKARDAWASALQVDAGNREAMRRLLDSAWAMSQLTARADTLNAARDAANRLLAVDPDDAVARSRLLITTVRGAEADVPTPRQDVEAAAAGLRELAEKDPSDAEAALWAGRAELYLIRQAADSSASVQLSEARQRLATLEKSVDATHQGQPASAAVQFRATQLYLAIAELDQALNPKARGKAARGRAGRFTDRVEAALAAARENVKPGDPDYVEIQLASAEWLAAGGRGEEAVKLLDAMMAARPDDPKVRLGYARSLRRDPSRWARVLEALSRPLELADARGADLIRRRDYEGSLLLEQANVRLMVADGERDPVKRTQALDQVRADVARLETMVGGQAAPVMELKGRLAHASRNLADAIALLQQAVDRRGEADADYDVIYQLATAYLEAGQTGQAEKQLRRVVARYGDNARARALLIRTLLADGQAAAAKKELAELKRRTPEAPEVAGLTALVEGGKARQAYVERMPEKTPAQKITKAANLRNEGKADEAIELVRAALADDPKFVPAVQLLIDLYLAAQRREEALAAANEALAANPDNAWIKGIAEQLEKKTPAELEQWRLEQIAGEPDPFARQLKRIDFHLQKTAQAAGDAAKQSTAAAEVQAHLDAAERLKPGDLDLASRRFELLLTTRKFDEAAKAIDALAAANSDQAGGAVLRYRLAVAREDMPAAEAAAREIARQRPQFAEGYQRLGQVLQVQGRHREALDAYTEALERQGRNYAALRGAIEANDALNQPAGLKTALDRARALFPRDVVLGELSLNYELRHGDPAMAVAERERAYRAKPDDPNAALALAETYLLAEQRREAKGAAPDLAAREAALAKARKVLEDGMAKWPAEPRFRAPLARVLHAAGDFAGGERVLKEYAQQDGVKGTAPADLLLAEYYAHAGKGDEAERSFRAAIGKSDEAASAGIRRRLAALLAAEQRREEAVRELAGVPGPGAALQRVQYLLADRKNEEAGRAVAEAVAANPTSVELSNLQLQILIDATRFDEARAIIDKRTPAGADDATARYFAALLKLRVQPPDIAAAIADLTAVVAANPRFDAARALLAEAQWAANNQDAAISELGRVLRNAPADRDVRAKLIEWCGRAGRWDAALKLATEAAENPATAGDLTWVRAQARALAETDKLDEAERTLSAAIARSEAATPERVVDLQRDLLSLLLRGKRHPKVLELTASLLKAGRTEWWLHQARGLALQETGDKDGAGREFDQALAALDPIEEFAAASVMVRTVAETAGTDAAIARVEKWTDLDPRWRVVAAELFLDKGDAAGAVKQLEPALAQAAELTLDVRASVYRSAGMGYHQLEPTPDLSKALTMYEQFLQIRPKDAAILNNVAYLIGQEMSPPDPSRAKSYSQRAYDIAKDWKPGEPRGRVLDTHGWVLILNGEVPTGMRLLEEVIEEHAIPEAHYHLAESHLREKRGEEAREQLILALALIDKAKAKKQRYEPEMEQRVRDALERAKALDAAAGAR